jgi:hypothetical protein
MHRARLSRQLSVGEKGCDKSFINEGLQVFGLPRFVLLHCSILQYKYCSNIIRSYSQVVTTRHCGVVSNHRSALPKPVFDSQ